MPAPNSATWTAIGKAVPFETRDAIPLVRTMAPAAAHRPAQREALDPPHSRQLPSPARRAGLAGNCRWAGDGAEEGLSAVEVMTRGHPRGWRCGCLSLIALYAVELVRGVCNLPLELKTMKAAPFAYLGRQTRKKAKT